MGLVSSALCCACQGISCACSLASCCCSVATIAAGGISNTAARLFTVLLLGVVTALCLLLRFFGDDLEWSWDLIGVQVRLCSSADDRFNLDLTGEEEYYAYCKGDAAVFRVSAATACFFGLMALLSLCSTAFHRGFWLWKLLLLGGAITGFLFLAPESFDQEAFIWVARVASVIFLFVQLFLILSFAYDWNDKWVDNAYAEGGNERCWLTSVLVSAAGLYIIAVVGIGYLYAGYSQCSIGSAVVTITLLACVLFTGVTLFRDRLTGEEGAVLPAAVIAAYIVFLAWSALEANPNEECKPENFENSLNGGGDAMAVNIVITALSIMWIANQSTGSANSLIKGGHQKAAAPAASGETAGSSPLVYEVGEGRTGEDLRREQGMAPDQRSNEQEPASENLVTSVFYCVMCVTVLYMSMVLTNWGAIEALQPGGAGHGQMWVKIISQWVTILLFMWTLLAPAVLSNREFGEPEAPRPRARPAAPRAARNTNSSTNYGAATSLAGTAGSGAASSLPSATSGEAKPGASSVAQV